MNTRLLDLAFEFGRSDTDSSRHGYEALKAAVVRNHDVERSMELERRERRVEVADHAIASVQDRIALVTSRIGSTMPRTFILLTLLIASGVSIVAEVVFTYDTLSVGLNLGGWEGWLVATGIVSALFAIKPPVGLKHRILPVAALLMLVAFTYLGWFRSAFLGLGDTEDIRSIIAADPIWVTGLMVALTLAYLVAASLLISTSMDYVETWMAAKERARLELHLQERLEDRRQLFESESQQESVEVWIAEMDLRFAQGLAAVPSIEPDVVIKPDLRRFEGVEGTYAQVERILEHHLVKAVEQRHIPQYSLN